MAEIRQHGIAVLLHVPQAPHRQAPVMGRDPKAVDEYHQQLPRLPRPDAGPAGREPGLAYPWRESADIGYGGQLLFAAEPCLCRAAQDKATLWGLSRPLCAKRPPPRPFNAPGPIWTKPAGLLPCSVFCVKDLQSRPPTAETAGTRFCPQSAAALVDLSTTLGAGWQKPALSRRPHSQPAEYDSLSEELFMGRSCATPARRHGITDNRTRHWFKGSQI